MKFRIHVDFLRTTVKRQNNLRTTQHKIKQNPLIAYEQQSH